MSRSISLIRRQYIPALLGLLCLVAMPTHAGPLRNDLQESQNRAAPEEIVYGKQMQENYDVYRPQQTAGKAPVIFMVHGGAWKNGDKGRAGVVRNKVARWVSRGFVLVSVNYPMLPAVAPLRQAQAVARALADAQSRASTWGADPAHFVLMGHSAGGHLIALLNARPALAAAEGARPWLGSVALDSAAMDLEPLMATPHFRFYDEAFGNDPDYWLRASPVRQLQADAPPLLMVCSTRRADACAQAQRYAERASALGVHSATLPQDLSHGEINTLLGRPGAYTDAVEAFMASLSPALARLLR